MDTRKASSGILTFISISFQIMFVLWIQHLKVPRLKGISALNGLPVIRTGRSTHWYVSVQMRLDHL
ncbi:hypothetical protein V7121_15795 [Neobacillus drentensis]